MTGLFPYHPPVFPFPLEPPFLFRFRSPVVRSTTGAVCVLTCALLAVDCDFGGIMATEAEAHPLAFEVCIALKVETLSLPTVGGGILETECS